MGDQWTGVITIIISTGAGLIATTAYLRGIIKGVEKEVGRQDKVDGDIYARVNRKVEIEECKDHREALRRELIT